MPDKTVTIKPGQTILIDATDLGIVSFVRKVRDWAQPQLNGDVTETLIVAFSYLIGITDVEAVEIANRLARNKGHPTTTTRDFRRWLPTVLSAVFAEWKESLK